MPYPAFAADERSRFFKHLLAVADAARKPGEALIRRQAIYLLAFDSSPDTASWLIDEHRRALRAATASDDLSSSVAVRSASVALARYGHQDPLLGFVDRLGDEAEAAANINYWLYWVGGIGETYTDDLFMRTNDPRVSDGRLLLEHLIDRLNHSPDQIELYVHTLWQLLLIQPHLIDRLPTMRVRAQAEIEIADGRNPTSDARRKLSDVTYALRLS